jgi:hypothetical protein
LSNERWTATAGHKKGGCNAAQLKIIDIAGQVLQEIDAKDKWKALLNCSDPKVMVNVMEYLTDRVHGRSTQTIHGNPEQPVTIQFESSSTPEWLPSVTVNQPVNHITTSTDRAEEIWQLIDGQTHRLKSSDGS